MGVVFTPFGSEHGSGLVVRACEEILAGQHHDMFPLHVWMAGSGTQFNSAAPLTRSLAERGGRM